MNKELLDFMLSISDDNYQNFIKSSTIKLKLDNIDLFNDNDYSWLDVIERYIPFIKNVVDNPYQEFLEIEASKKMYENRFLISLIFKLNIFLQDKYKLLLDKVISKSKRTVKVVGSTVLENEEIEFNLELSSKIIGTADKTYGLTIKQRLERIIDLLDLMMKKTYFVSLKDISLVHSPIHKTNVMLENQNYKKLLELWEFLENYMIVQKNIINNNFSNIQKNEMIKNFYISYFLNYQIINSSVELVDGNDNFYEEYLSHLIKRLVENSMMNDKTFKRIVNKKFEDEYIKKKNREKNIHAIFVKSMDNYQKQVKDAIRALK